MHLNPESEGQVVIVYKILEDVYLGDEFGTLFDKCKNLILSKCATRHDRQEKVKMFSAGDIGMVIEAEDAEQHAGPLGEYDKYEIPYEIQGQASFAEFLEAATAKKATDPWNIPDWIPAVAKAAAETIRDYCKKHKLYSGNPVFEPYEEYAARDGQYAKGALLIVHHEGTDANRALSMDGAFHHNLGDYSLYEGLMKELEEVGALMEQCTLTYSAIYALDDEDEEEEGGDE